MDRYYTIASNGHRCSSMPVELQLAGVGRILAVIHILVVGRIMAVVRMRVNHMAVVALVVSIRPSLAVKCHTRADPSFMVGPSSGVVPSSYQVVSTCLATAYHPS